MSEKAKPPQLRPAKTFSSFFLRPPRAATKREKKLGFLSFVAAAFAVYFFVDTFGWLVEEYLHPPRGRRFDYPPGMLNEYWTVPCLISLTTGMIARRTLLGKLGLLFSVLVMAGISVMVAWGLQYLNEWRFFD